MPTLTINAPMAYEHSADVIAAYVESVDGKVASFEGPDRRAHARYVVAIPSLVWPLGEELQPEGKPFNAVTRDISVGGIRLIHTQPVTSKYLGVKLAPPDGTGINLLVKVLRCSPLGAYSDVAGEFVTEPV